MLIVKIIGKILLVPFIVILSTVVTIGSAVGKIGMSVIGILNLILVVAGIASVFNLGNWSMVKQMIVFFVVENVVLVFIELSYMGIEATRDRMVELMGR